jgi:hypothetical protein
MRSTSYAAPHYAVLSSLMSFNPSQVIRFKKNVYKVAKIYLNTETIIQKFQNLYFHGKRM